MVCEMLPVLDVPSRVAFRTPLITCFLLTSEANTQLFKPLLKSPLMMRLGGGVGVMVGVSVGEGVLVGVRVAVAVGVSVNVGVGVGMGVSVAVGSGVKVSVGIGVSVGVSVGVRVGVVAIGEIVGVGGGSSTKIGCQCGSISRTSGVLVKFATFCPFASMMPISELLISNTICCPSGDQAGLFCDTKLSEIVR